jgi:PAS domain S-box-containing protein
MTDVAGNIIYVNPRFCEVTGYGRDEALGQNPRILQSGNTDRAIYEQLWATISRGEVWNGELLNRKKNGELYWELASIAPVKDDGNGVIGFVAVKEDITERRATEAQLRQAQKMQAIGQLTGGIAHDFNNLLTIIIGNLQLLGEGIGNQAPHAGRIADAMWAAQRGGELTHRLLAFARRQPLKPTRASLNIVARGLTDLLRRTLGAAITVRENLAADLPEVLIDTGEMERALVNLAINARDAMGQGGTLTLETDIVELDEDYTRAFADVAPGRYAMLAVSDTGSGMPADMLAHIFEPFFTTKPVGAGSGLGLSMVYGFVKQSGGHISVYSEVGRGTTFKLFFPVVGVEASATPAEAEPAGAISPFRGDGLVALVVEDEEKLRTIASGILADLGFRVLEAESGDEALRHAAREPRLDLLFTDLELPGGMPGSEVAVAMRRRFSEVKVLRTTGYSPRQAAAGDIPLLAKPYTRHDLIQRVAALFR